MRLFTSRFIKDCLWIGVFVIAFYALTHNPITHPQVHNESGEYSVELMQYPLLLGMAGHNYLVLRDDHGAVVRELHGLATNKEKNTYTYTEVTNNDMLYVWEFSDRNEFVTKEKYSGVVLFQGEEHVAEGLWSKALPCKEKINEKHIPYPSLGFALRKDTLNSNSVAYTLVTCMGLSTRHIGLLTPGETKNLLEIR